MVAAFEKEIYDNHEGREEAQSIKIKKTCLLKVLNYHKFLIPCSSKIPLRPGYPMFRVVIGFLSSVSYTNKQTSCFKLRGKGLTVWCSVKNNITQLDLAACESETKFQSQTNKHKHTFLVINTLDAWQNSFLISRGEKRKLKYFEFVVKHFQNAIKCI